MQVSSEDQQEGAGRYYNSVFQACQFLPETHDERTPAESEQARGEFRGRLLAEILRSGKPAVLPPYVPPTPAASSSARDGTADDGRSRGGECDQSRFTRSVAAPSIRFPNDERSSSGDPSPVEKTACFQAV